MTSSWEEKAADKRDRINASIPSEWKIHDLPTGDSVLDFPAQSGILSSEELAITQSSASELVKKLASGELKAVDVTVSFCKRAALAHQLVSVYTTQRALHVSQLLTNSTAKLLLGILSRDSYCSGQGTRCIL